LIFKLYYQDILKDVTQINRILITKENKDIKEAFKEKLD